MSMSLVGFFSGVTVISYNVESAYTKELLSNRAAETHKSFFPIIKKPPRFMGIISCRRSDF